ncbi:unnamed protein product [Paramecium sonneborni]|uniref:Uncharacterized protein n=1 Tax=Paramecium sonneborni TaxID=65129 RepID=A0A8S1RQW3_9CILI|nr:unnamed protein product [Paramecium sonneborni]
MGTSKEDIMNSKALIKFRHVLQELSQADQLVPIIEYGFTQVQHIIYVKFKIDYQFKYFVNINTVLDVHVAHQLGEAQQLEPDIQNFGRKVEQLLKLLQISHPFQQAYIYKQPFQKKFNNIDKILASMYHMLHYLDKISSQMNNYYVYAVAQMSNKSWITTPQYQNSNIRPFTQIIHQNKVDSGILIYYNNFIYFEKLKLISIVKFQTQVLIIQIAIYLQIFSCCVQNFKEFFHQYLFF